MRLRERLPLVVFILLLLLLVLCVGFAYACTNDHPGQALEHSFDAAAPAAVMELWTLIAIAAVGATSVAFRRPSAVARSPGMLQRLLL